MAKRRKPGKAGNVYFYQFNSEDCYKIGKTANENPEKRKQAYRSGVAGKLTFRLKIFSEDMSLLETYIHWILDHGRTENREVFRVGWQEVETAIEQALAFMVNEPFLRDADSLRTVTPKDTFVDPSPEMFEVYRQLRKEARELFLLERSIDVLQAKIAVAIGENSGMTGIASWAWQPRAGFNMDDFKADHPDLYEKYRLDSGSRRFVPEDVDLTKL
jgi:hypothetical protein